MDFQKEYTATDKKIKKRVRQDKRKWADDLMKKAEEAAATHNMRELYKNTILAIGRKYGNNQPIRNRIGVLPTAAEQHLERSREHYEDLLKDLNPKNEEK
ncbi:hypothetical protein Zmor_001990 [Zophobas morio]|uniref:Uncharacterized protein n=1 Tax=Zophobas morio TaxID=2755281 RepID=A0AA38J8S1_9CUCU|nr:hypothetical protein Zmor_001990 [Zophobas morio]